MVVGAPGVGSFVALTLMPRCPTCRSAHGGLLAVHEVRRASFGVSTSSTFQTFGISGLLRSGVSIWVKYSAVLDEET